MAAAVGERRARGRARQARGPRARAGKTGRGLAGWLARAEQAEPARPSSSLFLFLFYFPSSLFEFNFDFQIWIPNWCTIFIGVFDMRPTTYLYKY